MSQEVNTGSFLLTDVEQYFLGVWDKAGDGPMSKRPLPVPVTRADELARLARTKLDELSARRGYTNTTIAPAVRPSVDCYREEEGVYCRVLGMVSSHLTPPLADEVGSLLQELGH